MSQRKFAAFDIDGTLFRSGLYREVFFELMNMGAISQDAVEVILPKMRDWHHRVNGNAFEEFEIALTTVLGKELPRIRITDYDEAARAVIQKQADNVYRYSRDLLNRLKGDGYFMIAISGSQEELVEPFATKYGFDAWVGQQWERGDKFFTGNIVKTHKGKDVILQRLIDTYDLALDGSWAVGDSNGDIGMLKMVERPIAFNPTAELLEKAKIARWDIVMERKNVIYTLRDNHGIYQLAETN